MALEGFLNAWSISAIIFILFIVYFLWRDRKNIERHGIIFIRRTKRGIELLDKIAKWAPGFWRILSTLGVVIAFGISIFTFFFLISNLINGFITTGTQPGLALVLPTLGTEFKLLPGVFLTPFWFWIIAIFLVVLVHEGMHGIIGRVEGFKISSVGWAIIGILPAAFVEPEGEKNIHSKKEEKEVKNVEGAWHGGSFISRLRVVAAGSLGNFLLGSLLFLAIIGISTSEHGMGNEIKGLYDHNGVKIIHVTEESPAGITKLPVNITITEINGRQVRDVVEFREVLDKIKPGEPAKLKANETYTVITSGYPEIQNNYSAKVRDYVYVQIERIFPIIEFVEKTDHPLNKLARWQWIQENFEYLDGKAEVKIQEARDELVNTAYLGVVPVNEISIKESMAGIAPFVFFLFQLLTFVMAINIGIGMANLLPLKPLDGGLLWEDLFSKVAPRKTARFLLLTLGWMTFLLIVVSLGVNFI